MMGLVALSLFNVTW